MNKVFTFILPYVYVGNYSNNQIKEIKMIKIKLNLFESIVAAIVFPNIVFLLTTIILIISLVKEQEIIVYKGILISYAICLSLMILSLIICFIINHKSKKEFILNNDEFIFLNNKYAIKQIRYAEYYVCKWYRLLVAPIYKKQIGGLITFKLDSGEKIQFKILYKDYLKIKNKISNIIEK